MQQRNVARTCSREKQQGHAAEKCSKDEQQRNAARTCSREMQLGHAAWTYSKPVSISAVYIIASTREGLHCVKNT
jgi:hypothetical protein